MEGIPWGGRAKNAQPHNHMQLAHMGLHDCLNRSLSMSILMYILSFLSWLALVRARLRRPWRVRSAATAASGTSASPATASVTRAPRPSSLKPCPALHLVPSFLWHLVKAGMCRRWGPPSAPGRSCRTQEACKGARKQMGRK